MSLRFVQAAAVVLIGALPMPSGASDAGERRVSLGGFGTLGLMYHDEEGLEYRRSESQPGGAEAGRVDVDTDSLLGLQLNAAASRSFEGVIQAVSRQGHDGAWTPRLTRGFLRYAHPDVGEVQLGRIGWEIFPRADSRDVGYSNTGVRPPVEMFGFFATDHFDGVRARLRRPEGAHVATLSVHGGRAGGDAVRNDGSIQSREGARVWGGELSDAFGVWTLTAGAGVYEIDHAPDLEALGAQLRQSGSAEAAVLAERLAIQDRTTIFAAASVAYEGSPASVRLMLGSATADGIFGGNLDGMLLTAGYRFRGWTPYVVASAMDNRDAVQDTGLPDTPQYQALNAAAHAVQSATRYSQETVALGLRYEVRSGLALKLQVDRVAARDSVLPIDRRPQGGEALITVFGAALDFVF